MVRALSKHFSFKKVSGILPPTIHPYNYLSLEGSEKRRNKKSNSRNKRERERKHAGVGCCFIYFVQINKLKIETACFLSKSLFGS